MAKCLIESLLLLTPVLTIAEPLATIMKNFYTLILFLFATQGFSQNSSCQFSDGNYHYNLRLVINEAPSEGFNKADFISFLETNSNISTAEVQFLNDNIIELFRQYHNPSNEAQERIFYVISNYDSLDTYLSSYPESISFPTAYCDCLLSNGSYNYFSALIMDDIPAIDFDKDDYIEHLELNSDISTEDIDYLNSTITEVYRWNTASNSEPVQRALVVLSSSDTLTPFLINYSQAIDYFEFLCDEAELAIDEITLSKSINIIPNPIIDNFSILISNNLVINELIVYDVMGKIILRQNVNSSNNISINKQRLDTGVYFFKFIKDKNSTVKKVIVK